MTPVSWEDRATPTASVAATPTPVTLPSAVKTPGSSARLSARRGLPPTQGAGGCTPAAWERALQILEDSDDSGDEGEGAKEVEDSEDDQPVAVAPVDVAPLPAAVPSPEMATPVAAAEQVDSDDESIVEMLSASASYKVRVMAKHIDDEIAASQTQSPEAGFGTPEAPAARETGVPTDALAAALLATAMTTPERELRELAAADPDKIPAAEAMGAAAAAAWTFACWRLVLAATAKATAAAAGAAETVSVLPTVSLTSEAMVATAEATAAAEVASAVVTAAAEAPAAAAGVTVALLAAPAFATAPALGAALAGWVLTAAAAGHGLCCGASLAMKYFGARKAVDDEVEPATPSPAALPMPRTPSPQVLAHAPKVSFASHDMSSPQEMIASGFVAADTPAPGSTQRRSTRRRRSSVRFSPEGMGASTPGLPEMTPRRSARIARRRSSMGATPAK